MSLPQKIKLAFFIIQIFVFTPTFCQIIKEELDLSQSVIKCEEFKDAKETIKKVYTQQMDQHSPNTIEVTDEYIAWSKEHVKSGGLMNPYGKTTISLPNTVYFKSVKDLRVISKRGRYEIRYNNKANDKDYIVFLKDKDLAIEGYFAIECMVKSQGSGH